MKEKNIIKTENLSAGYYGRAVVQGAEIELCAGEILTLIGPNGSGKSTMLVIYFCITNYSKLSGLKQQAFIVPVACGYGIWAQLSCVLVV